MMLRSKLLLAQLRDCLVSQPSDECLLVGPLKTAMAARQTDMGNEVPVGVSAKGVWVDANQSRRLE